MTTLNITFLIAFSFPKDEETFGSLCKKQFSNELFIPLTTVSKNNRVQVLTSCPISSRQLCGIKYTFPKHKSVLVTLAFWGSVVKIFFDNQIRPIKCILKNHLCWLSFSLTEIIENVDINFLKVLHSQSLSFEVSQHTSFILDKARKDRPNSYIFPHGPNYFNPNDPFPILGSCGEDEKAQQLKFKNNSVELLEVPSEHHLKSVLDFIWNYSNHTILQSRTMKIPEISMSITGEQLFFEKPVWHLEEHNISPQFQYCGMWFTCENLLTIDQRNFLQPLSVHVEKIENLPKSIQKEGIKEVALQYSFGRLFDSDTSPPIKLTEESTLLINSLRTTLNYTFSKHDLIKTFQSKLLFIQIYGIKEKIKEVQKCGYLFGQNLADQDMSLRTNRIVLFNKSKVEEQVEPLLLNSKDGIRNINEVVFLGAGVVNCSSLSKKICRINTAVLVSSDPSILVRNSKKKNTTFHGINLMDIHYEKPGLFKTIIKNEDFILNNTIIKVVVRLGSSIDTSIERIINPVPYFTRFVIYTKNHNYTKLIMKEILKYNNLLLGQENMLPIFNFRNLSSTNISMPTKVFSGKSYLNLDVEKKIVSGFLIDSLDQFFIVIECLSDFTTTQTFSMLANIHPKDGKMVYDSQVLFTETERMYDGLIRHGGFYCITMGQTLDSLLLKPIVYLQGTTPHPARRLLLSLDLIRKCHCVTDIIQQNLLPTVQELLSFDIEFGVPYSVIFFY